MMVKMSISVNLIAEIYTISTKLEFYHFNKTRIFMFQHLFPVVYEKNYNDIYIKKVIMIEAFIKLVLIRKLSFVVGYVNRWEHKRWCSSNSGSC